MPQKAYLVAKDHEKSDNSLNIKKRIPLSNYITAMEKEKSIFYFRLLYYYMQ